jgi:hypothetical protein
MDKEQEKVVKDLLKNNVTSMISYLEKLNVEVKKKLKKIEKENKRKCNDNVNGVSKLVHNGYSNEIIDH